MFSICHYADIIQHKQHDKRLTSLSYSSVRLLTTVQYVKLSKLTCHCLIHLNSYPLPMCTLYSDLSGLSCILTIELKNIEHYLSSLTISFGKCHVSNIHFLRHTVTQPCIPYILYDYIQI